MINNITLTEAKDSSAIENIITTYNELYQQTANVPVNNITKEVTRYSDAIKYGYEIIQQNQLLTNNHIININNILQNLKDYGFRNQIGTVVGNSITGEIVYIPPQPQDIPKLMDNLESYINDNTIQDIDPLVKMAIIHHQFESIHPFFDGNGRTGRIINILYLIMQKLIDSPILYLSRHFIKNKDKYYELIQNVRDNNDWKPWILFVLDGIECVAEETIVQINSIVTLQNYAKIYIKQEAPKIYSRELLDHLFLHTYTTVSQLQETLKISRQTATKYLNELNDLNMLQKLNMGKQNYFVHTKLYDLLINNLRFDNSAQIFSDTTRIYPPSFLSVLVSSISHAEQYSFCKDDIAVVYCPEEEWLKAKQMLDQNLIHPNPHINDYIDYGVKSPNPYYHFVPVCDQTKIRYIRKDGIFNNINYQFIATNLHIIKFIIVAKHRLS